MLIVRFFLLFFIIFIPCSNGEIINNKKIINKDVDIWRISCKEDEMLNDIECRLFLEITEGTTLFINPKTNKILLVSTDGYYNKRFFVRVDNNKLIKSKPFINNKYNIVDFENSDTSEIFSQIMQGQKFYIRFTIKDNLSVNGFKEITAKFYLAEFQKALVYYNKQVNKYNFTINNID